MAQTSKGRRQQLKTQAQATSREMGGVFEDLSKRIGAQFKDSADKAAKAWGSAAKEAASSWYDVEEASKRVGTSEYQNIDNMIYHFSKNRKHYVKWKTIFPPKGPWHSKIRMIHAINIFVII